MNWKVLRRADGEHVFVDADLVLGIWDEGEGCRLWSLACGHLEIQGTAAQAYAELDIERVTITPEERALARKL